jgi:prolyl-tRNA editing enzyme YbaK/EbsC (Cys-tRNA(Pro) deacylase)
VIGRLTTTPALDRADLLGTTVVAALTGVDAYVAEIDPDLADTAAFCEAYDVPLAASANCVVVAARRGGETRFAACVVLATTRVDVNGFVRRHLDARKVSFAAMDLAVTETAMEYGGITPFGLPESWPVLVDSAVLEVPLVVVGSGLRRSKLVVPGSTLAALPRAEVVDGLAEAV